MRSRLSFFLIALTLAAPAGAATRNFGVSGFDKVRVDGPFKVRLATGVAPFARASGPDRAIDKVAIDVQGSTLVVHVNQSGWGGYPGDNAGPVEIAVGTHDLSAAWVNGSGSLDIDQAKGLKFDLTMQGSGSATIGRTDVDQLRVSVLGTANATLAGRAGKLTAVVRGLSSLDASGLSAKDAAIAAEGGATVSAQVANDATVEGTGTTTVTLSGTPSCRVRVSGSATVSGCKASQ